MQTMLMEHVDAAGKPGQRTGKRERCEVQTDRRDTERLRRKWVVPTGDERTSGATAPNAVRDRQCSSERTEAYEIHRAIAVEADPSPKDRTLHAFRHEPWEEARRKEERRGGNGERERCHREERAAYAQRGEPDHERSERCDTARDRQGEEEIEVVTLHERPGRSGAETDERELSERDVAGPAGKYHE